MPSDRPRSRPNRTESFALVGVMSYDKGPFAFFEGSRSDYQKVLKQDDSIAGFKVAAIEPAAVKLSSPTNEIELHVGMQMRREDEGEWKMSQKPENLEAPVRSSTMTTSYQNPSRTTEQPAPAFPDLSNPETAVAIFSNVLSNISGFPPPGFNPEAGADPNAAAQLQQTAPTNSVSTPQNPGNVNDALERLRRRREQENNP